MGFSLSRIGGDIFSVATLGLGDEAIELFTLGAASNLEELGTFAGDVLTGGAVSQRDATKQQQKALKVQQRQAAVQNARSRRKAIAAGRRSAATATASAAGTGGIGSSGLAGFQSGTTTATAANVSFQRGLSFLESRRLAALSASSRAQGRAAIGAGAGSLIRAGVSV